MQSFGMLSRLNEKPKALVNCSRQSNNKWNIENKWQWTNVTFPKEEIVYQEKETNINDFIRKWFWYLNPAKPAEKTFRCIAVQHIQ